MVRNKILLIDMYGVILKESKGFFIPYTLQHFEKDKHPRILKAIKEEKCFTQAQLGKLSNEEFLKYLGYVSPQKAMEDYLQNYLTLDEQFKDFAEGCEGKYELCLLSNDVLEWSEYLTDFYRMNTYFKDKIVSGEVHMRKPDKNIFLYALERLQCVPEQCVFVDNSVKNLLVAEELGIDTILFNRDGEAYQGKVVDDFMELSQLLL